MLTDDIILLKEVSDNIQNLNWNAKFQVSQWNSLSLHEIHPFVLTQAENPNSKD